MDPQEKKGGKKPKWTEDDDMVPLKEYEKRKKILQRNRCGKKLQLVWSRNPPPPCRHDQLLLPWSCLYLSNVSIRAVRKAGGKMVDIFGVPSREALPLSKCGSSELYSCKQTGPASRGRVWRQTRRSAGGFPKNNPGREMKEGSYMFRAHGRSTSKQGLTCKNIYLRFKNKLSDLGFLGRTLILGSKKIPISTICCRSI